MHTCRIHVRSPLVRTAGIAALLLLTSLLFSACYMVVGDPLSGQFRMRILHGPVCGSPSGWCALGTASGDLSGDVFIRFTNVTTLSDDKGRQAVHLAGTFLLITSEGELHGTTEGRMDAATGHVRRAVTVTHGTGRYHKTVGTLDVWGNANLEARIEEDGYSGGLLRE
jgi:hypothetical protein